MTDVPRNRLAKRRLNNIISVPTQADSDELLLIIRPHDAPSFDEDLIPYRDGQKKEELRSQSTAQWRGDFTGRPQLIAQLAPVLAARHGDAPRTTWLNIHHALRSFWRYLDADSAFINVVSLADIDDAHGPRFRRYIFDNKYSRDNYKTIKTILRDARHHHQLPDLFWAGLSHQKPTEKDVPDRKAVITLYSALKSEGRQIKAMFAKGERLASMGHDPRGELRSSGSAGWDSQANHAWLIRELTREYVPTREEFNVAGAWGLYAPGDPRNRQLGPSYLAPTQTNRSQNGIVGKLRWFFPSIQDTTVFFLLFLVGTGWNSATTSEIDISSDNAWFRPHPIRPDLIILHSWKARSRSYQTAISMLKPEWHPCQIVRFMIERTEILRKTLHRRMAALDPATAETSEERELISREHERLSKMARSPWLYTVVNKTGEIGAIDSDTPAVMRVLHEITSRPELRDHAEELKNITTRTFRDAWIGYAYEKSGFQWLVAQMAAGHTSPDTLRRYLAQRRWRLHGEKQIRALQDALMHEIRERRIIDGAALRILVENGNITPEQRNRLEDYRMRTRLGTGCMTPTDPPDYIEPSHRAGAPCRGQRCTICAKAVIFPESLDGIARRKAELIIIQERIPVATWMESSFADEMEATDLTLALFDPSLVTKQMAKHLHDVRRDGLLFDEILPRAMAGDE